MKPRLLSYLVCPSCKTELKLQTLTSKGEEIIDGMISCASCARFFPIISGVPRMLIDDLARDLILIPHAAFAEKYATALPPKILLAWREKIATRSENQQKKLKIKTAQSFGYEWNTFLSNTLREKIDVYRRDFFAWLGPIKEEFFKDKVVLEAGCGVGRHTFLAAQMQPKDIISIDLSEAVAASYENTKDFPNAHVVQADIYHLPFAAETFDFIFSIGVLHHLPNPEGGFQSLVPHLKKDGTISLWLYGRRHNFFHVYFNETIRHVTRNIPHKLLHALCYAPAVGIHISNLLYRAFNKTTATRPLAKLMPFKIYADLPFSVKLNDAFDVFATPRSTYWKKEEIELWSERAGCKNIAIELLRKKSLTAYGIKG